MGISIIIALVCVALFAWGIVWFFDEDRQWTGVLFIMLALLSGYGCVQSDDLTKMRAIDMHDTPEELAKCQTPKLVTSKDGVNLYVYYPDCNSHPVYFSKSGTQTQNCHVVSTGRTAYQVCDDVVVPNSSKDNR